MNKDFIAEKIITLSSITSEINNPNFPNLEFYFISAPYTNSNVKGLLKGLSIKSISSFDCIEYDCISESGIWTKSIVDTDLPTKVISGEDYYFVKGTLSKDNTVWNVDLGTLCLITGEISIFERYRPINERGYFESLNPIPDGLKIAILNRYTSTNKITIGVIYGDYLNNSNLIHSFPNFTKLFNASTKATFLEEISLGLINLILANYKLISSSELKYFTKGEFDPYLKSIIDSNISSILSLIDNTSVNNRLGSIPSILSTYLVKEDLYGSLADNRRVNPVRPLVLDDCIQDDCLEVTEDTLNTSRLVSNRAVAWFLCLLLVYSSSFQDETYSQYISSLSDYLLRQFNNNYNLIPLGWSDSSLLSSSSLIDEYTLSTNVVCCIALSKVYEYKGDLICLERSADIYESIINYFYDIESGLFLNKLNDLKIRKDSVIYGFLFATIYNRQDILSKAFEQLNNYIQLDFPYPLSRYLKDNQGEYIEDLINGGYQYETINRFELIANNRSLFDFFKFNNIDSSNFLTSNYLFCEIIEYLNETLGFSNSQIQSTLKVTKKYQGITYLQYPLNSLFTLANQLDTKNLFNHSLFNSVPIEEIEGILFQKTLVLNKLKSFIPLDYSWFSQEALDRGNIGQLLKSFVKPISVWYGSFINLKNSIFKETAKGTSLTKLGVSLGIPRYNLTDDFDYKNEIVFQEYNNSNLLNKLDNLGITTVVTEPFNKIAAFNGKTINELYSSNSSDFYFEDNSFYTINSLIFKIYQPINPNTFNLIEEDRRLSLHLHLEEHIVILEDSLNLDLKPVLITDDDFDISTNDGLSLAVVDYIEDLDFNFLQVASY